MFELIDLFLHLDKHLVELADQYGNIAVLILFIIVFCETGLVVTPFLPGDSLLFAAGSLCASGFFNVWQLMLLLFIAAVLGDAVNYHIAKYLGPKVLNKYPKIFKPQYIKRTEQFFEKYGNKTIVIARFVPIVRTFAPFLAGIGTMNYRRFLIYNVSGAALWVGSLTMAGYFFGALPIVKNNFGLVVVAIIVISVLPIVFELWKGRETSKA